MIRLRHMLDAANEAASFIQKEERASLDLHRRLVLALIKLKMTIYWGLREISGVINLD